MTLRQRYLRMGVWLLVAFSLITTTSSATYLTNGGFEAGLTGWTTGGSNNKVDAIVSTDIIPPIIVPPEGSKMALLSNGPGYPDLAVSYLIDGNAIPDFETSTLSQTFTLGTGDVPAELSFKWSFLTSECTSSDDFFQVTLNGNNILTGSATNLPGTPSLFLSPYPDVGSLDGISYRVVGGLTSGSYFSLGRTAFQSFSHTINTPGTYTLEFLVADQRDPVLDSGLLVDDVKVVLAQPADIPEFPTIAIPVIAILGLAFIFQRRKD